MFKKKSGIKRDIRIREIDKGGASTLKDQTDEVEDAKEEERSSLIQTKRRKFNGNDALQNFTGSKRSKLISKSDSNNSDDLYQPKEDEKESFPRKKGKMESCDDATRSNTWYDDDEEGGSNVEQGTSIPNSNKNDGLYKGMASYKKYSGSNQDGISSTSIKGMVKGPIRANNNVRTVTMVDYQPSVCKPYKETGTCGFGDSCIYLHDRSDYLAGWQMDKLPNSNSRIGRDFLSQDEIDKGNKEEEEDLPFACLICRKHFVDPVVTNCGHYFCSNCAIKRYNEKSTKCFACNKQTQGIFNSAKNIIDRMKRVRHALSEEKEDDEGNFVDNLPEGVEIG